jgi:MFS family permease
MPRSSVSYKSTVIACYFACFSQAIVINLAPILFIPLKIKYGLSFTELGALVFVNFVTQVICDIVFSGVSDRYGFRPLACLAPLLATAGFAMFALTPELFPGNIYLGLVISTVIFSGSGGILEITVSPILNSIPGDEKASAMSILHSFYAWGQVAVVVLTSLTLYFFGGGAWRLAAAFWAVFPLAASVLYMLCPLAPPVPEKSRVKVRELIFKPFFAVMMLLIFSGAATELCISQWSSSFAEKALGMQKLAGDIFGMSFFALMLGVGRLIFGLYGAKLRLSRIMAVCSFAGAMCYIAVALSQNNIVSLAACGLSGLCASLLWPGTLVIAGDKYPLAGASMFAVLACAGDIGGSAGPWFTGILADTAEKIPFLASVGRKASLTAEQLGLRAGLLFSAIFPLIAGFCLIRIIKKQNNIKNGRF